MPDKLPTNDFMKALVSDTFGVPLAPYRCDNWSETINAMHSGEIIEIGEDVFDYFLEVLPPVYMKRNIALPGGRKIAQGETV